MNSFQGVLPPLACFLVATAVQPIAIRRLRLAAVLDLPGHRSSHKVPTPRGGGIAVGLGLLVGTSVATNLTWLPLIVAMSFFFAIGLAEDLRGVPILARLGLQLLTSALVSGLLVLSGPPPPVLPVLAVAVATVWIAYFANAFNFMDGINGISGAHAVLGGLAFAAIAKMTRDPALFVVAAIVVAAGLAFLPWNAVRAKVFLGDVGSYTLGAVLAVLAVYCVLRGVPIEAVLAPLSLYLADTGWTLLRRIASGKSFLQAHREHAYQRLCAVGWSHQGVTILTFGVGLVVSALGALSIVAATPLRLAADVLIVVVLVGYLAAPRYLARHVRLAGTRPLTSQVRG